MNIQNFTGKDVISMKRMLYVFLCLALLLLAGCGAEVVQSAEATAPSAVTVGSVDALLAALAPGAEIVLEPGTYFLSDASDYGEETDSPYYSWVDAYDGYELKLTGLQDVTLRGSGMGETVLSAAPRHANVLTLQNCTRIRLQDFTAGHTEAPGECSGGVLAVLGCMDVDMTALGLYGCGTIGLNARLSTNIRLSDSDIYDCSSSGIIAEDTQGLAVENCRLYDLGEPRWGGYTVFELTNNEDVVIRGCEIRNCLTQSLINAYPAYEGSVTGNTFLENRVRSAAFDVYGTGLVLDSNQFSDNVIRRWYSDGSPGAVDAQDNLITEEQLSQSNVMTKVPEKKERTEITVTTVDEFLAAIAPDTEIILDGESFDFSTAANYGITGGEYYYWEDIFDGPGLVISGVENFAIRSTDGDVKKHTLAAVPRYANVLTFSQCSDVTLSGFTAGHTEEPGSCTGGVLLFRDSDGITVENCGLYGCGILGVQAEYCGDIRVLGCDIYECSYGGIEMRSVSGVTIEDCTFRDLGGSRISLSGCSQVTIDGKAMEGYVQMD